MAGGIHRSPGVVTQFFPGFLAGFVIGGIAGTLIITHIATASLRFFWQSMHKTEPLAVSCADLSSLRVTVAGEYAGGHVTAVALGAGQEHLFTVNAERMRIVPSINPREAYLVLARTNEQPEPFPASAIYRIDFCKKSLVKVLDVDAETYNILGMSVSGLWVFYEQADAEDGVSHAVMNTLDRRVFVSSIIPHETDIGVKFSPREDALAWRSLSGARGVWELGSASGGIIEHDAPAGVALPAWGLWSISDYFAQLQK